MRALCFSSRQACAARGALVALLVAATAAVAVARVAESRAAVLSSTEGIGAVPKLSPWQPGTSNFKHRCLFLTGMGVSRKGEASGLANVYEQYWGDLGYKVASEAECEPVFLVTDTIERGWDTPELVREYCDAIEKTNASVVVTHSMGGAIIANGIHNKISGCTRIAKRGAALKVHSHANSVAWLVSQTPFRGSVGCDFCVRICEGQFTEQAASQAAENAVHKAALKVSLAGAQIINEFVKLFCDCVPGKKDVKHSIRSLSTKYVSDKSNGAQLACPPGSNHVQHVMLTRAQEKAEADKEAAAENAAEKGAKDAPCVTLSSIAHKYVSGLMCGTHSTSISKISKYAALIIMGEVINSLTDGWGIDAIPSLKSPYKGNDGMVAFESCRADFPREDFTSRDPHALLYALKGSHADGSFRLGDSLIDPEKNQQPVDWVLFRIKTVLAQLV
jgi:hypothetical protein